MEMAMRPYRRCFRRPLLTAHGSWSHREGLIVRLGDGAGRVGYGEIAPLPWFGTESLAEAIAFCQDFAKNLGKDRSHNLGHNLDLEPHESIGQNGALQNRALQNRTLQNRALQNRALQNRTLQNEKREPPLGSVPATLPATRFGLGSAWEMLQDGAAAEPIALGPEQVCGLLPAGEAALAAWPELWAMGHRTFKWKIGTQDLAVELALFDRLLGALPGGARLRLDANGGLGREAARRWLERCDGVVPVNVVPVNKGDGAGDGAGEGGPLLQVRLEFLEQPLPPGDVAGLEDLSRSFRTAIALDESVTSLADLRRWQERGWRGIWVIKGAIAGFPWAIRAVLGEQAAVGRTIVSTVFETGLGQQAVLGLVRERRAAVGDFALGFGVQHWLEADGLDCPNPAVLWERLA